MDKRIFSVLFLSIMALATPPATAARVTIEGGQVEGVNKGAVRVFKGMPYAAPPVGPFRWRPPRPAPSWTGIRHATAASPACPQLGRYPPDAPQQPYSEDCLTLNVWTPATNSTGKLPVMVWIHGGGLADGSGSLPQYAGEQLAARGVVVVTINYRLGVLGFLSHPELNKESRHGVSGNYGLLDQIAALKWVSRNISAFGGDPRLVTIFGQSSGSFSASMLAASPLAKGLFRRVIGQSGAVFEPVELDPLFTPEGAAQAGTHYAGKLGARTLAELRRLPVETLLKQPFNPQFNIDGHVLPANPHDTYAAAKQNDVDLLVGTNADEGTFFFDPASLTVGNFDAVLGRTYPSLLLWAVGASPGKTDEVARRAAIAIDTDIRFRWGMWAWARHALNGGQARVYFYRFAAQPAYRASHPYFRLGATHGAELPFVFGAMDGRAASWNAQDRELAATVQQYWINFARTGDPNGAGLPSWPMFDRERQMVMELGPELRAAGIPDLERLQRIDRVYGAARFLARNLYVVIGAAVLLLVLAIGLLLRLVVRRRARRSLAPA